MEDLGKFAKEQGLQSAYFSAIGTCSTVELGFFNEFLKDYRKKPFVDNLEILSLTGNIASSAGAPAIHAHGCFGNNDFEVKGGHIFKLIVSATCEVFLLAFDKPLLRERNSDWNLNLLN